MKKELYDAMKEYNENMETVLIEAKDPKLLQNWWDILNFLAK